jgi:transposase
MNRQIAEHDQQIGDLIAPLYPQIEQLISIPGVEATAARAILAEIGTDMTRFGSDARLASWAGVCPGNHESAGKRRRGQTLPGNRDLRRCWCHVPGPRAKRPRSSAVPSVVSRPG